MKTKQEILSLQVQWSNDPCWDIETTEGFEEHRQELYIYRLEVENKTMRRRLDEINETMTTFKKFLDKF